MPLTLIRIENVNHRWIAEVELGGLTAKRTVCRHDDFDGIMYEIAKAYHEPEGRTVYVGGRWFSPEQLAEGGKKLAASLQEAAIAGSPPMDREPVVMRSSAELYAEAGTTAETADADRAAPQNTAAEIVQARAELHAQAAEQAPWGRKKDGTPKKRPGRSAT